MKAKRILCAAMAIAAIGAISFPTTPITVSAAAPYSITEETSTVIAPGLTQGRFLYTDGNGNKNTCYTLSIDPKDPQITLAAGTPGDGDFFRISTVRDMTEAALINQKRVVASINSDMYNTSTGEPWGVVVKDGREIHGYNIAGRSWKFFGLRKDNTPIYGDKALYEANKGDIQQALGVHSVLVNGGKVVNPDKSKIYAPRVAVGVKADNSIFFLLVDGRQSGYSKGLTLEQTAQLMKYRGAVWSGNLDGGGSATLLTRANGASAFTLQNKPSDGRERKVANCWLFLSNTETDESYNAAVQVVRNSLAS